MENTNHIPDQPAGSEEEILSQIRRREAENEALKKILDYLKDQPDSQKKD